MTLRIQPVATLQGEVRPPSDKSLTHRAYLFGAIADGESRVMNPLRGEDCESTLECLNLLGLRHEWVTDSEVRLIPVERWVQPVRELDCGNSGTTMRLLSGLLASRDLDCTLIGDASLSRRPMKRIAEPLRQMGALVEGDTPPLRIKGGRLQGIDYISPVASAQVKSCTLLAGLGAEGVTRVTEPSQSRDHTERMLRATGVEVIEDGGVSVRGGQTPHGFFFSVPADISSAAFLVVAASVLPQGRLVVRDLSVNPSRTGLLDVLDQVGVPYEITGLREELGEPVAELELCAPKGLRPFEIAGALVPRLIDEIPVLAVLATQCEGQTVIRDARELRVKESDRVEKVAEGLRAMGANVETFEDGFAINGPTPLKAAAIEATGDHRIAMAFAVAGLLAEGETVIHGADSIATSYPTFERDLQTLSVL
jgi:3-phosphoshikimate 1-carboxyvinyltransferase